MQRKVCVYAIAKNEAQFVDRFMDSMSEADEICVLDTGSSDDTVARLQARGANVAQKIISPWRFDAARNESMRLIPGDADICCCIDLDEAFHPGWRETLENAWQDGTMRARYRYTWSFRPGGREGVVFWADKIHANGHFHWEGAVHEVLAFHSGKRYPTITVDGLQLDHHPDPAKSRGQYLPLLELAVQEDPHNDRNCHYLGREYMYHGEYRKAIATLERHIAMPESTWADERCASMRYLGRCCRALGEEAQAVRWYLRAIAEAPHLREPYLDFAALLYAESDWDGVVWLCRRALAITERPRTYICEAEAWGELPYDYLTVAYSHLGNHALALESCRRAAALAPADERIRKNLEFLEGLASAAP